MVGMNIFGAAVAPGMVGMVGRAGWSGDVGSDMDGVGAGG